MLCSMMTAGIDIMCQHGDGTGLVLGKKAKEHPRKGEGTEDGVLLSLLSG